MTSRFLVCAACLLLSVGWKAVQAQVYRWQNYTNKDNITSLEYQAGYVWGTTTGGIVRVDPTDSSTKAYINTDGLGSIRVSFSTYTGDGFIYFGSADGWLSRLDIASEQFTNTEFQDRDGARMKLYNADSSHGFLWIACDRGVVKFDRFRHDGEVKEIYRTLGVFPTETPIYDVAVFAGNIYAGGAQGIAYADAASPYLLDPAEWRNIPGDTTGINADTIICFEIFNDRLYVGTDRGLFNITGEGLVSTVAFFRNSRIYDLAIGNQALLVIASSGSSPKLYSLVGSDAGEIPTPAASSDTLRSVTYGQHVFIGTTSKGIYRESDTGFVRMQLPGPTSNDIVGGGVTATGSLYVVSRSGSFARLHNSVWESIVAPNVEKQHALVASDGSLWVGTWAQGAFRYSPEQGLRTYNATNSPLSGPNLYVGASAVARQLYEDPAGNVWFTSYQGSPMRPMIVFNPAGSIWNFFDASVGIKDSNVYSIAAGVGMAALGFRDLGVAALRYGSSPFDHSGDTLTFYGRERRLPSTTVNALAFDRDNRLWVGTNSGLAYFDADIEFFFAVSLPEGVSSDVTAITTDSRNNVWVGTAKGLAFISEGQTQQIAFTSENSELVANAIQSLSFDPNSGCLLVFTNGGLSILDYNLSPQDSTASVYAYPNPFVIQLGVTALLKFRINQRATVRIYTISGDLVRETDVNTGWDGQNDGGQLVASGIYIYELRAEDATRHSGKIFVLRR
jgi:ligand-binding sensor domain-containing protein